MENFREFRSGPDPFGETWLVWFKWLQTAISIRHSDTIDVKFVLSPTSEADTPGASQEKTIALYHPAILELAKEIGVPVTDPWCARLAKRPSRLLDRFRRGYGKEHRNAVPRPTA